MADASIVVNTLAPLNEGISGNDDLGDLKRLYQGANSPAEQALEQFNQVIADTGQQRTRLLQSDVYCDLDPTGTVFGYIDDSNLFHAGDCYPLRWHLDWALSHGLTPHVAVASFMPRSMVPFGEGETWASQGPAVTARYVTYMQSLVRYIATRSFDGGASNVIFEVSNELDIADSEPENFATGTPSLFALKPLGPWGRWLWWPKPSRYVLDQWPPFQAHLLSNAEDETMAYPYRADVRRLSRQVLPVQKIVSDAISTIRREFADQHLYAGKTLELAGPAFAGLSFTTYHLDTPPSPTMEEQFLDQTFNPLAVYYGSRFNTRLDRFSFHFYGSTGGAAGFAEFDNIVDTINAKLQALKQNNANMPDVPLFISEWGPTYDEGTDINISHKGAAWAAAFLPRAVTKKISLGSYLIIGDGQGSGSPLYGQASLLHKQDNGKDANGQDLPATYYPKPVANLFAMYTKMSGLRRQATLSPGGSGSHLGTFATWDAASSTANIMVYNYDPSRVFGSNTSTETPEGISLEVDNLPFSDNSVVTIERYAIDADTSNLTAFYSNPAHPSPNLQRVLLQRTINNGKLVLTGDQLKLGVLLYRVLPPGVMP